MQLKLIAALIGGLIFFSGCSRGAETSAEFASKKMRVLFEAIRPSITSGFGESQVAGIESDFASMAIDQTKELVVPIVFDGVPSDLHIRYRKEDVDVVEVHFVGTQPVIGKIQAIIKTTSLDI